MSEFLDKILKIQNILDPAQLRQIPLQIPDLGPRERVLVQKCLEDNWVSSAGPDVPRFEAALTALTGRDHAVAVVNGTTALALALQVSGVRAGDRVLVPEWTFAGTANAVIQLGAKPCFVDIAEPDLALDPALVAQAIARLKPAAVMIVHALGRPAALDTIASLCAEARIPLIEDAAGAIGARFETGRWAGRMAGSAGAASCFSFNGNKIVTTGGGGALLTDDPDIARLARHISAQARTGADYFHDMIGFNNRMPNLNAALGIAQLERLDEMITAKKTHAAAYDSAFSGLYCLQLLPPARGGQGNAWLYGLLAPTPEAAQSLVDHLRSYGIEARRFWMSLADQPPYRNYDRVLNGTSTRYSATIVTIPCSSQLTVADRERVIDAVINFDRKNH